MKNTIGYIAAFLTTFSMLPQIIRIMKLREARDVSIFMPVMVTAGAALWLVYGIMIRETPIMVANGVSLILNLATLVVTIRYR
jgi:MtN3 and saliva related transmembrane protein